MSILRYKHVCISSFLDESSWPQRQARSPVLVESIDLPPIEAGECEKIKLYFAKLPVSHFNYPAEILAKNARISNSIPISLEEKGGRGKNAT